MIKLESSNNVNSNLERNSKVFYPSSKILFEARISYLLDHNQENYIKTVCGLYDDWRAWDFEKDMERRDIIIFGCGHDGKEANKLLSAWGYKVLYFCDSYKFGGIVDGKKVLSIDEVVEKYRNYAIVIASSRYGMEI